MFCAFGSCLLVCLFACLLFFFLFDDVFIVWILIWGFWVTQWVMRSNFLVVCDVLFGFVSSQPFIFFFSFVPIDLVTGGVLCFVLFIL